MSQPSNWPLPAGSARVVLPLHWAQQLAQHALTQHLYPVALGHYVEAHGHHVQRPQHTDYLLIFCYRGHGWFRTEHAHGQLHAGQLLLLPAGQAHAYAASASNPWSIYWAHYKGTSAPQSMALLGLSLAQPVLSLPRWQPLVPLVDELLKLPSQQDQLATFVAAATLLQRIFAELPRLSSTLPSAGSFDLAALDQFMLEHLDRDLSLDELAQFAGLSRYHFSKKFKQLTGTSPMRYFNQVKIKQACQQLDTSTHTIRDIGQSLGFDDPYYFSRLFKKVMGVSPQNYRSSHHRQ